MHNRRLISFWAQGESAAPEIVRRCWDAWVRLNPDWTLTVFTAEDTRKAFADRGIPHAPATYQGQADILRLHELDARGGLYVDAGTVPMQPLSDWIDPLIERGFFAFHDPYRRRSIENWFLASTPGHPIIRAWMAETVRYWQTPRRQQVAQRELDPGWKGALQCAATSLSLHLTGGTPKAKQVLEPKSRSWSVSPDGGARRPVHPYFWPHYLFDQVLRTQPDIHAAWSQMPKMGSYKDLMIRHWKRDYDQMTPTDIDTLSAGSRMQKLALNGLPSQAQLDHLFARIPGA